MFAVKGWNVSASTLKTQTAAIPNISGAVTPSAKKTDGSDGGGVIIEKSKKRKRGELAAPTPQVTDANIGDIWGTTMEEKKPNKKERARQKRLKMEEDAKNGIVTEVKQAVHTKNTPSTKPTGVEDEGENKTAEKSKKNKKNKKGDKTETAVASSSAAPPAVSLLPAAAEAKLTPLQAAMRQKLISARFRHLNETLYTAPSTTSLDLFAQNPEMFADYHSGFRQQVTTWPSNPLDHFITAIRSRGSIKPPKSQKQMFRDKKRGKDVEGSGDSGEKQTAGDPLPRTHGTAIIADLGCGDARLASTLTTSNETQTLALKIHSFDLQSPHPLVTKSDVANLPLADGSVDIAIFCLALMGTNWIDFVEEAYRILHWKGELWIAEIKSRFGRVGGEGGSTASKKGKPVEHAVGNKRKLAAMQKKAATERQNKDDRDDAEALRTEVDEDGVVGGGGGAKEETDVSAFIEVLRRRGFVLKEGDKSVDMGNKMFVRFEFLKAGVAVVGKGVKEAEARREVVAGGRGEERKTGGETWKPKDKKKFIEKEGANADKEVSVEDEAKVLKPCLYKIR